MEISDEILIIIVKISIIIQEVGDKMSDYNKIQKSFQPNEPILIEDMIKLFPDRSRYWVDNTLKALVSSRQLLRFSTGVYYIPGKDVVAGNHVSVEKVATRKYITDGDSVYGYYSGSSLRHVLGIIDKKPNTITVVTNNESSRGRNVTINGQKIHVARAPVQVTRKNHLTLQMLEAIKLTDKTADKTTMGMIYEFARVSKIT